MEFKTFGEWLRHLRLQKEISPFKMSEALGYKRVSAIYNFEYGIAPLPMAKWPAIAGLLGLSLDEFLVVMERYSPEKVAEFRLIRNTAGSSELRVSQATGRSSSDHKPVITATALVAEADHLRTYQTADAEAILVTREPWEDSLILALDQLRRQWAKRLGLVQVIKMVPFPAVSVVSALRDTKTVCVLERERERVASRLLADRVKAAFLDALTGEEGFSPIHRAPKIFSVGVPPRPDDWAAEEIEEILRQLQGNGCRRHLNLKLLERVPESLNSR